MTKWIVFVPITIVVYLYHRWYLTPKRIKARNLKRVRKSQQQFCDW